MCCLAVNCLWPTAIFAVKTLICAADFVQQKQAVDGRTSASDASRSDVGKRRLRDLVLSGVNMKSMSSYDASDNGRSVAELMERLLHAGHRYFELDVREDSRLFYWSTSRCSAFTETVDEHEEISPALVALASFSQQFPSDVFVLRFVLESQPELRASSGSRLLATISASIGSRSVPATRVFESTVDEVLSTQRNVVVLVHNLSSTLPSSAADASVLRLPNIFVKDNTLRNETEVSAWNVVDRGGLVLEQHRSVDTLSVLTLNWQKGSDASTSYSLLSYVCHSSLLPLFFLGVVVCWSMTGLNASRSSVYKVYGGLATASAVVTFLLAMRMISSNNSPTVGNTHLVNNSCSAVVDAVRHWIARPSRYRLNIFVIDYRKYCCGCACSGVAGLAALANAGRIRRQVSLTHAGNPLSDAVGLRAIFACPSVLFAYVVTSRDEGHVVAWNHLIDGDAVDFEEGQFPMDATVAIYVATVWNRWLHVSFTAHPCELPLTLQHHRSSSSCNYIVLLCYYHRQRRR